MKKKSSKLAKLERNRYSILTDNLEECYICHQSPVDLHEIYGGCNRRVSMEYGFCLPLCRMHHSIITNNNILSNELKVRCQKKFEETHTRNEFMALIGRSYL